MRNASLNEVKKELTTLPEKQLIEICIKLVRFKKDNKELVSYLLFDTDPDEFLQSVKNEIGGEFAMMPSNFSLCKKTLRKIQITMTKYFRFDTSKVFEAEIRIHFCECFNDSRIDTSRHPVIENIYLRQLKAIQKAINSLHEDLQFDYHHAFEQLKAGYKLGPD